jgi:hypothetical protein
MATSPREQRGQELQLDPLNEALRAALPRPVPILESRGYTHVFERSGGRWHYPFGFDVSPRMMELLTLINENADHRAEALRRLTAARDAKAEAEAGDLWDGA